jgi:hypothetical protein
MAGEIWEGFLTPFEAAEKGAATQGGTGGSSALRCCQGTSMSCGLPPFVGTSLRVNLVAFRHDR